ncbi:MAG: SDR family oxidoreductase [Peptostreptococcaceae bacterium]|nr:SDR family oxidoreductase [Peptostreptococcaceae bacterium]
MRILILGSSGMVGHVLMLKLLEKGYDVTGISHTRRFTKDTILLDLTNQQEFDKFWEKQSFDLVINCCALLVQRCEERKTEAININAFLPHLLEEKIRYKHTKLIHISTDGVFDGIRGNYIEEDFPNARTFYGRTKALGEVINNKDLTIRSSFIGPDISQTGSGLLNWFFQQREMVNGFQNVRFNGITSIEFSNFIINIIEKDITGIYHLHASEVISKGELLIKLKKQFGLALIDINNQVTPCSNHALLNTRNDFNYTNKSYDQMLIDLKNWIYTHEELYPHYKRVFEMRNKK